MVDEQDAIQMVHLVLETGSEKAIELLVMGNAIVTKPLRADAHGPFDIGEHLRNRQAALAVDAEFLGFLDDLRIDEKERRANAFAGFLVLVLKIDDRSEEHTSELQSLMRISYAVFCLKKKKRCIHIPYNCVRTKHDTSIYTIQTGATL